MSELKACTWCGEKPALSSTGVYCANPKCHAVNRHYTFDSWAIRPIEDKLQSDLASLRHNLKEACEEIEDMHKLQIRQVAPDRFENTPIEVALREVLDILRAHNLIEEE